MHGVEAKAMWLVRISKVAKCIDPAFASRYYENLSVGGLSESQGVGQWLAREYEGGF